jgi:hypothetical protein
MAVDIRVTELSVQVASQDPQELRITEMSVQVASSDGTPVRITELSIQVCSDGSLDVPLVTPSSSARRLLLVIG